jgi:hypothetical protein
MTDYPDLDFVKRAVARWTPLFRLHPADAYLPCSAEFFMQHSELRMRAPGAASSQVLAPRGTLDGAVLCRFQTGAPPGSTLWMELDPGARCGAPPELLPDVPVYAHAKAVASPDGSSVEAIEINYITVFAFNGHYNLGGLGLLHVGAHDGDIEHCTARVHPRSGELLGMWYNSHRSRDGEWVPGPQVPRDTPGERPVAYVALHGHGTYPRPGRVLRHFCLGNDKCSDNGPAWLPHRVVLLPNINAAPSRQAGGVLLDEAVGSSGEPPPATETPPVVKGGSLALLHCSSRGCAFDTEHAEAPPPAGADGAATEPVAVDVNDPCEWLWFGGDWGQTPPPIAQRWFHTAETPVSRTALQRLFLHFWPETEAV